MSIGIIPALLETQVEAIQDKLNIVATSGNFEAVQIDVIDGELLPNLTVSPYDLVGLDFGSLKVDFHLMTNEPLDYIWEIAAQGSSLPVRTVYGQIEHMGDQSAFLAAARQCHFRAGLALDLDTPLDSLDEASWASLDEVLLMSVPMGAQGQTFDPNIFFKIDDFHQELAARNLKIKLLIDGGIRPEHLAQLIAHRVDSAAIGSFLWAADFEAQADALTVDE